MTTARENVLVVLLGRAITYTVCLSLDNPEVVLLRGPTNTITI